MKNEHGHEVLTVYPKGYDKLSNSDISQETCLRIAKLLLDAGLIINEVECELHDSGDNKTYQLKKQLLIPDPEDYTIWSQLYRLEKLFRYYAENFHPVKALESEIE